MILLDVSLTRPDPTRPDLTRPDLVVALMIRGPALTPILGATSQNEMRNHPRFDTGYTRGEIIGARPYYVSPSSE